MHHNPATISWSLPDAYYPKDDNSIWYVRINKNGTTVVEVYNDKNSYIDESALLNDIYQISAVNYYFLELELSVNLK